MEVQLYLLEKIRRRTDSDKQEVDLYTPWAVIGEFQEVHE